jgi:ParB family chromosome partitioning protein
MALGRGLGDILSEVEEAYEKDLETLENFEAEANGARIEEIDVERIVPNPYQPRKHFDEHALQELAQSIQRHGLLQPIVVVETESGYILVAGERRWRAHKIAGLHSIKAIVAEVKLDELRMRELALVENIQRENLNPLELARSYAELIEVHNITHDELAAIVHKSRSHITNTMRLLALSDYAQQKLIEGKISQGHAKVLVGLEEDKQKVIIDSIIGQKLSVRETENLVRNHKIPAIKKERSVRKKPILDAYAGILKEKLPFVFKIKGNKLEIDFQNDKEVTLFLSILEKHEN